jgi:hypothetical protein
MKRFFKAAALVDVGIVVGSSGTQVLRAQSKLPSSQSLKSTLKIWKRTTVASACAKRDR